MIFQFWFHAVEFCTLRKNGKSVLSFSLRKSSFRELSNMFLSLNVSVITGGPSIHYSLKPRWGDRGEDKICHWNDSTTSREIKETLKGNG